MSQAKVDQYKKEKANRKSIMKKQHMMKVVRITVCLAVVAVIGGWIGYSGYSSYEAKQPRQEVSVNYDSVTDYLTDLYSE